MTLLWQHANFLHKGDCSVEHWPTRAQGRKLRHQLEVTWELGPRERGWLGLWWSGIGRCRRKRGGALETDLKWEEVKKDDSGCWGWSLELVVSATQKLHIEGSGQSWNHCSEVPGEIVKAVIINWDERWTVWRSSQALELDGFHPREEWSS